MIQKSSVALATFLAIGATLISGCQQSSSKSETFITKQTQEPIESGKNQTTQSQSTPTESLANRASYEVSVNKIGTLAKDLSNLGEFRNQLNQIVFFVKIQTHQVDNIKAIEVTPESFIGPSEYFDLGNSFEKEGLQIFQHESQLPLGSNSLVVYRIRTLFVDGSESQKFASIRPDLYVTTGTNGTADTQSLGIRAGINDYDIVVFDRARIFTRSQKIELKSQTLISINSSIETFESGLNGKDGYWGLSGGDIAIISTESLGDLHVVMRGLDGKAGGENQNTPKAISEAAAEGRAAIVNTKKSRDLENRILVTEEICVKKATDGEKGLKGLPGFQGSPGGRGGNTGRFFFGTKESNESLKLSVEFIPGKGGIGGPGGKGGKGGPGGQPGKDHPACDSNAQVGPQGDDGDQGPIGVNGEDGKIETKTLQYF